MLLAVASFAILVAQFFGETCQPVFSTFEFGLCVLPGPLGPGFDIVFEYPLCLGEGLCGLGTRLRATRQLPTHTQGQSVQEAHLSLQYKGPVCPLTLLENMLRRAGGGEGYSVSFIERYLVPLVYPDELTRELQLFLGGAVVAVNAGVYFLVLRRGENLGRTESSR